MNTLQKSHSKTHTEFPYLSDLSPEISRASSFQFYLHVLIVYCKSATNENCVFPDVVSDADCDGKRSRKSPNVLGFGRAHVICILFRVFVLNFGRVVGPLNYRRNNVLIKRHRAAYRSNDSRHILDISPQHRQNPRFPPRAAGKSKRRTLVYTSYHVFAENPSRGEKDETRAKTFGNHLRGKFRTSSCRGRTAAALTDQPSRRMRALFRELAGYGIKARQLVSK